MIARRGRASREMTGPCPGRLHSHRPHGGLPLLTRLECPQKHRLRDDGQVIIETEDGQPLTQRQLKLLRDEKSDVIQRWLEDGVAKLNADYVKCVNVHIETPNPSSPKWQTLDEIIAMCACEADLSGANLSEANLFNADLTLANLSEANLSGADLSEADLTGADLHEANLSGAKLHKVDLYEANLSGACLIGADLRGANLHKAELPIYRYEGLEQLLANLPEKVIAPSEGKVKALQERRREIELELTKPQ